jgi:4-hydroxy-3-methylbut-2-enyl diphosphate reductase
LEVKLAENYGFCFGVKRAIKMAESSPNSVTLGPLIHNPKEIGRLEKNYNVKVFEEIDKLEDNSSVIIRTHGIPKNDYQKLKTINAKITDATCPYVKKPQQICEQMQSEGYDIVIFGDINHPEVKGVMSYAKNPIVVLTPKELEEYKLKDKVAVVSQTTKKISDFQDIVNYLILNYQEIRVFNTICNATFENQDAAKELSKDVDIMIVIGGKNSSNTKQLFNICKTNCEDSYLIESKSDLMKEWFVDKNICGVTAGASTPDWIIEEVIKDIKEYKNKSN